MAGGLVVLVCDQQTGGFVIALDRKTGRQRWKTERRGAGIGWATPMLFQPSEGTPQLIVLGLKLLSLCSHSGRANRDDFKCSSRHASR